MEKRRFQCLVIARQLLMQALFVLLQLLFVRSQNYTLIPAGVGISREGNNVSFCPDTAEFKCEGVGVPVLLEWFINGGRIGSYSFRDEDVGTFPLPVAIMLSSSIMANITSVNRINVFMINITSVLRGKIQDFNESSVQCGSDIFHNVALHVSTRGPVLAPTNFELLNEVIEAPTRRTVQVMWDHTSETQHFMLSCSPKVCSTTIVNNTLSATIVINSLDEVTLILYAIHICESNSTELILNRTIFPISGRTMELMSTQEYIHTPTSDVSTVSGSDISIIVATNISSFLIGLVVGISVASIVFLCIWRIKKRRGMSPSSHSVDYKPPQAYEDVDIVRVQDMQLQQNVAYGQVKGL